MNHRILILAALALAAFGTVLAFAAMASAAPTEQVEAEASACQTELLKWIDPDSILLGEGADVTMVVSGTCPSQPLPVDLVILADESFSMTKSRGSVPRPTPPTKGPTPDPRTPGPKPTEPGPIVTPGPGDPGPGANEPPFCNPGGMLERTPTATPTKRFQWRTPTPSDPRPQPTAIQEYAGDKDQVRDVQGWIGDFLNRPEIQADFASGRLRMGCVTFSQRSRIRQSLTDDPGRIESCARRMNGNGITRINEGVREVERILNGSGARNENGEDGRIQVAMILSDFQFCQRDMTKLDKNVHVFSVGFGVRTADRAKLSQLASQREYISEQGNVGDIVNGYNKLAVGGRPVTIDQLTVRDELSDSMALLPGTIDPPTVTVTGQVLEWQFMAPTLPMTLGFAVEPMATGVLSVSTSSNITYTDSLGLVGAAPFPDVAVEVVAYTPTPTPTFTPTPTATDTPTPTNTPTPIPDDLFMPIAYNMWPEPEPTPTVCKPEEQTVDLALVIDTSTSMGDPTQTGGVPKLDAAIEAAQALVDLLKPGDQTAVIGFNSAATVATVLTEDMAQISAALTSLPATQQTGTRIDLGLLAGLEELTGERHRAENNPSIILVTDGRQVGDNQDVRDAAQAVRDADITLITIGLGGDVDEALLREIASSPEMYFQAPNAEDLVALYREIVRYIPCP